MTFPSSERNLPKTDSSSEKGKSVLRKDEENLPIFPQIPQIRQQIKKALELTKSLSKNPVLLDCSQRMILTSTKIAEIKKVVDTAIKQKKTFTAKGGWNTIRQALLSRGWVEKFEKKPLVAKQSQDNSIVPSSVDYYMSIIPEKQSMETIEVYQKKCERLIISDMLKNHVVDFYWNMSRPYFDRWNNPNQILNRYNRSPFSTKDGLNYLLKDLHWYTEPGVSQIFYPRSYTLGFADEYNFWVEDFRLTACISFLKWYTENYDKQDTSNVATEEGNVPFNILEFAIKQCTDYIAISQHADIDKEFLKVEKKDWDNFLDSFYKIIHEGEKLRKTKHVPTNSLKVQCDMVLLGLKRYWPQINNDGTMNVWILKPANRSQGKGIRLIKRIEDVEVVNYKKFRYVVQKYIEKPLLIYNTKFDIRAWYLVTSANPLTIWMYREWYLRFSSKIFDLCDVHESVHLTNYSVQKRYKNVRERDPSLPNDNMWDCETFKNYLKKVGLKDKWDTIVNGLSENFIGVMIISQDMMDTRANSFNLYGADFIVDQELRPWLLEINSCPDMTWSTSVTSRLCPKCLEDVIKVVVDKRRNPYANTGEFTLIYKQTCGIPNPYSGKNLFVKGIRVFKNWMRLSEQDEKNDCKVLKSNSENKQIMKKEQQKFQEKLRAREKMQTLLNEIYLSRFENIRK